MIHRTRVSIACPADILMIYAGPLAAWIVMTAGETILGILRMRYLSRRVGELQRKDRGGSGHNSGLNARPDAVPLVHAPK